MDILQLIQLKLRGESNRSCSKILSIHRNTINYYVRQLKASGLQFSDLLELSDTELCELFPTPNTTDTDRYQELSAYFSYFKKQMLLPGCTRETLWQEYLQKHPEGYGYTQFNEHLNKWLNKAKVSGKLNHKAGEKVFVDYCGKKLRIADKESGELRDVEVFVGILPCSGHTFVEASYSQKREDFIGSMNNCLQFYGGSPKAIVTDNLKAAVSKASKYEAVLNKSLKAFALHYNCVVNPTRTYSPQDKALVEGAVKLVYQRIYFPLRNMIFFSLEDLNRQLKTELEKYNNYLMNTYQASRKKLFLDQEQAYLQSLPPAPYQIKHYKRAKVQKMGYIYLSDNKNYYSVPYRYIGKMVELQYNSEMLEIYYQGERISSHKRSQQAGYYSTIKEHLHSSHRFYSEWSPEYFQKLSADVGPNTSTYIGKLIQQQDYPELGYKQALGIIALKKAFSRSRIELACSMAQSHDRYSYRTVKRILENNMDKALQSQPQERSIPIHLNIRGSKAYC
ncbi:IS21 family transposase [Labilibaculum euxinus]